MTRTAQNAIFWVIAAVLVASPYAGVFYGWKGLTSYFMYSYPIVIVGVLYILDKYFADRFFGIWLARVFVFGQAVPLFFLLLHASVKPVCDAKSGLDYGCYVSAKDAAFNLAFGGMLLVAALWVIIPILFYNYLSKNKSDWKIEYRAAATAALYYGVPALLFGILSIIL